MGTIVENRQTEEETSEPGKGQSLAKNLASCDWYSTIAQFLLKLEIPPGLNASQVRTIKLRAAKYCIHENLLYWRDPSGILLRCLDKEKSIEVMQQFHSMWRASLLENYSPQDLKSWILLAHLIF